MKKTLNLIGLVLSMFVALIGGLVFFCVIYLYYFGDEEMKSLANKVSSTSTFYTYTLLMILSLFFAFLFTRELSE